MARVLLFACCAAVAGSVAMASGVFGDELQLAQVNAMSSGEVEALEANALPGMFQWWVAIFLPLSGPFLLSLGLGASNALLYNFSQAPLSWCGRRQH
jgi:hypothetical protein